MLIAVMKLIGTSLTVGVLYLSQHSDDWHFIAVVIGSILILDLTYGVALYRPLRRV